jgi:hypothetical protein
VTKSESLIESTIVIELVGGRDSQAIGHLIVILLSLYTSGNVADAMQSGLEIRM